MSKLQLLKGAMIASMLVGFTGCVSTSDIEVESAKSEKVNLDGYKTYAIVDGSGIADGSQRSDNMDVDAEMKQMVNAELAKKGKMPVTQDPDFYVAYVAGSNMDAVTEKLNDEGKKTIESRPAAAIILVFIDAKTNTIIAASVAEGEAKNLSAKEAKERLSYTIKKMLKDI